MKVIKADALAESFDESGIQEFAKILRGNEKFPEATKTEGYDPSVVRLYLSEDLWNSVSAYNSIILSAMTFLELVGLGLDPKRLMNVGVARKDIEKIIPSSSEGFEKFGDGYAYYWTDYFFEKSLIELRKCIAGSSFANEDAQAAVEIDSLVGQITNQTSAVEQLQTEIPEKIKANSYDAEEHFSETAISSLGQQNDVKLPS